MLQLNYKIHLILNNRYFFIYKLLILFFVYVLIYNKNIIYCMNEDNNLPDIPRPNREIPDLIKNIKLFAGSRASAIEAVEQAKDTIIASKNQEITELTTTLQRTRDESVASQMGFLKEKKKLIASQKVKIAELEQTIVGLHDRVQHVIDRNTELERSFDAESRFLYRSLRTVDTGVQTNLKTAEAEIQTETPNFNESDPKYREFKRYPVYPVPFFGEHFSLHLQDEFYTDDNRIIKQSEGYLRSDSPYLQNESIRVEVSEDNYVDIQGFFVKRTDITAQTQSVYYPPQHPLNGFKPAGEIIDTTKQIVIKQ